MGGGGESKGEGSVSLKVGPLSWNALGQVSSLPSEN